MTTNESSDSDDAVTDTYWPDQDRSLSGAVLDAVEAYLGEDLSESEFTLYESIDPDGLDALFRDGAEPNTIVAFDTDDVRVTLWGDGGVEIRVTERRDDPTRPPEG